LVRKLGPFTDIDELVSAVRAQPRGNGADIEEALEDAMQRCVELVGDIGPQTILVLTDAPAHLESDCPYGIDFHAEVGSLLRAGCRLQIATDHLDQDDEPWTRLQSLEGVILAPLGELTAQWRPGRTESFISALGGAAG
jgi:hypothetical protein